jgi:glycosyl transferase family 87
MNARLASWSQPASPFRAVVAAALAMIVFGAAWGLLHRGFYKHSEIVDTPVYQNYGDAMVDGKVPYRDFGLEYPPAALPVFAVPSLLRSPQGDIDAYRDGFELVMALCGELAVLFVLSALLSLEAGPGRFALGLGFAAVAPLLIGSVVLTRFDLWPAALTVGALAAFLAGRERIGAGVLGLAVAAKLYPLVLVPLAAVWVWRRSGRRGALVAGAVFLAVLLACFLPFLVLAPHGVLDSVTRQTGRPLQIESLGAGVLLALHQAVGLGITMESSHGSQNLAGSGADALAALLAGLQLVAIVGVWVWFARGPADSDRLTRAFAAAVCAFIAFGKVLSPQFLIWLVPLVVLVRGRRGLAAGATFALALVLTQLWFPFRYWPLALHFAAFPSWMVFLRDLTLVALFAVLLVPRRPRLAALRSR